MKRKVEYCSMLGNMMVATIDAPYGGIVEGMREPLPVNCGRVQLSKDVSLRAFVVGVRYPVRTYQGQVIATFGQGGLQGCVLAPAGRVMFEPQIRQVLGELVDSNVGWRCLYEKACGAIVYDHGRLSPHYLLIQNRGAHWGFPKGHIELGETEMQTARREIREETGVSITFVRGFRRPIRYRIFDVTQKEVVYFLARMRSHQIQLQHSEVSNYARLPYEAALQRLTYDSERSLLRVAHAYLRG